MEILVATGNAHKLIELAPLFPGHRLRKPADVGHPDFDVEEDGSTYIENALKKARALYELTKCPSLADDSGLAVRALGGEPGIRSARYGSEEGGQKLDSSERNRLLLVRMHGFEDRRCSFICALAFVFDEDRFFVVQESCPGQLLRSPRGKGGFGYDPVVFLPALEKSVAELSQEEKNEVSHRGRAGRRIAALISDLAAWP
jgi:XTP/dITP diphosphohydrolase